MTFDPERPYDWRGDFDELEGWEQLLCDSPDLCEHLFASKHEAFAAGLSVGETTTPTAR